MAWRRGSRVGKYADLDYAAIHVSVIDATPIIVRRCIKRNEDWSPCIFILDLECWCDRDVLNGLTSLVFHSNHQAHLERQFDPETDRMQLPVRRR